MADRKFTQLPVAGALAAADLLAIAQSPFGAGSSKSITGTVLAAFVNSAATGGPFLPLAGGTLTGLLTCGIDGIAETPTLGLLIKNSTAATVALDQHSPYLEFRGTQWETTGGTSVGHAWRVYSAGVQSTTGSSVFTIDNQLGASVFNNKLTLTQSGSLTVLGGITAATYIAGTAKGKINFVSDGVITLWDNANTNFTRLQFGGTTSSFPAISRSTTNLVLVLADGTGNAGLTTGNLTTVASRTHKYLGINAATVLDATHYCVNATANTFDVTLPTAVAVAGRTYVIKNSGTGVVTLKANGAETIDAVASWIINQYTSLTAMSDGAGWILI